MKYIKNHWLLGALKKCLFALLASRVYVILKERQNVSFSKIGDLSSPQLPLTDSFPADLENNSRL